MILQLVTLAVLLCIVISCVSQTSGERYVCQKIPIKIESGKSVTLEIILSGNGPNDVGIRCSSEVWHALTNGKKTITARLKSSNIKVAEIYGIYPSGSAAGFLYLIPNVHYLFEIYGAYHAKVSVEITFPNTPKESTHEEIIVCKTPADTGP